MPHFKQLTPALRRLETPRSGVSLRIYGQRPRPRWCSCSAPGSGADGHPQLNRTSSSPPTPALDHRTLAQAHDLFITSPYSPGSPLLLPNGAYVFQRLQAFLRAQYPQFGYQEVITPTIYKKSLWETSGHWQNYADDMFSVQARNGSGHANNGDGEQDEEFGLKPMNCPGHCLLFADDVKSYRDLPIRYADFSALHRNETSGALTGLTRVRRFHQDDAHIFCRPDQISSEIVQTLRLVGMVYSTFGLGPYKLLLSTRPKDHYIGTVSEWDRAEQQLTQALNNSGREWALNEGDGAFYGPKIDIVLNDSNGKEHQTATIQLDFQLPQRFDLQYQASPEELQQSPESTADCDLEPFKRRPVIIHRAIYGSLERFMALLIEHYAGIYPFWLSPRPAIVLSLNQDHSVVQYASHVQAVLSGVQPSSDSGELSYSGTTPHPMSTIQLPVAVDASNRSLGKKLAEARAKKYNHIIVVGDREVRSQSFRLQFTNQPNLSAVFGTLQECLGRQMAHDDQAKGSISTALEVNQARSFYEALVHKYL